MPDVNIKGAEKLERIAKEMKRVGDKELRRELYRGINRATKPIKEKAKQAALDELPKRGGLNRFAAKASFTTRTSGAGNNIGVRIVGTKKGHDIRAIDRGRLRHPVFGNRSVWVTQRVKPRVFTDAMTSAALANSSSFGGFGASPREEIIRVLDDVARKLADG